ncbi:DUF2130 domain-containing protein [Streptococcus fryi]
MNHHITCPHCGTAFQVNETEYGQLLSQVRGIEFDKEIHERLARETALLEEKAKNDLERQLADKDMAILTLQGQLDQSTNQAQADLAVALSKKEQELTALKAKMDKLALEKDMEWQHILGKVEKERDTIKTSLALQEQKQALELSTVKQEHALQLKAANEQVEFYKNFKAQQSTKAIGESLELYAENEFNKVRHLAFPNAYFEKDNLVSNSGSKGDYIYRETDDNGIEILSIMFEMKNEADETVKKHKNEDFFKELDKDRREKNCEYAVLVSMLETDNDYYNIGIVDVSHKYDKMYVVRPQFFIQLIGLLRNAALNTLQYKQELALVKEQNIDITHFEEDLEAFKNAFAKNYHSASNNFQKAIDEIDKAIRRMEEVKKFLTTSENQLRLANNKLDDVSVKRLTRKNPTMKAKFDALKESE